MDFAWKRTAVIMLAGVTVFTSLPPAAQGMDEARPATSMVNSVDEQGAAGIEQGLAPHTIATAINTTVADIARNPIGYDGRNVAVVSTVDEIYSPWSIRLDERQLFAAGVDNDLLVVAVKPLAFVGFREAWKGRKVHVTGTVRILKEEDVRSEFRHGVDDNLLRKFAGKPVIIAKTIKPFE